MSATELRTLAEGVRRAIHDTPAWRALVQQYGRAEAERILRLAIYGQHGIRPDGKN